MPAVTQTALDLASKPKFMQAFGNLALYDGEITLTSNNTIGDIWKIVRVPAGTRIHAVAVCNADADTGGTTLSCKWGYAPVGAAPVAVDDYFSATKTFLTAAAWTWLDFKAGVNGALTVDLDIDLIATITAAATTPALVKIRAMVLATVLGVK
jgi:hypothetical protein